MTTIAILSVTPVVEGSMAPSVARAVDALETHAVSYETTAMGTIIEADDAETVFKAARAAHEAVDADRVSTRLEIDDKRTVETTADAKVDAVEDMLDRPPRSE